MLRREAAALRREKKHLPLVDAAPTPTLRLLRLCYWLASEAKGQKRIGDTIAAVRYLITLLHDGQPLPGQDSRTDRRDVR